MTENFDSIIKKLEFETYNKQVYLNHFLGSIKSIDEMDYEEFLIFVDNEIEDNYRNKFICEWKDYAFLRGKLETAKQLKEIVEKAINELQDHWNMENWQVRPSEFIKELRKSILGGEE